MFKKSPLRGPFDKQHGKRAQALLKSVSQQVYDIQQSLPGKLSWKKSLLLTGKILGLLVNTSATNEKYSVLNRDNLPIPIQMQLSQKNIFLFRFVAAFLKSRLNFEHFELKCQNHSFCISEITESEKVVR